MEEFDETAFRKALRYVELNADGTVKIYFSDEEAFKKDLEIARKALSEE